MEESPSSCAVYLRDAGSLFRKKTGLRLYLLEGYPGLRDAQLANDRGFLLLSGTPYAVELAAMDVKVIVREFQEEIVYPDANQFDRLRANGWKRLRKVRKDTGAWVYGRAQNQRIFVIGTDQQRKEAKRVILERLRGPRKDWTVKRMDVSLFAGWIIGKNGSTINKLSQDSGAKMFVAKGILTIKGTKEQVEAAVAGVEEVVKELEGKKAREAAHQSSPRALETKRNAAVKLVSQSQQPRPTLQKAAAPQQPPQRVQPVSQPQQPQPTLQKAAAPQQPPPSVQTVSPPQQPQKDEVIWEWQDETGAWRKYSREVALIAETAYLLNLDTTDPFCTDEWIYRIVLHPKLEQKNVHTKTRRPVQRRVKRSAPLTATRVTLNFPAHWPPMTSTDPLQAVRVPLATSSSQYDQVAALFYACNAADKYKITSIELVQCVRRWKAYSFNRTQYLEAQTRARPIYERHLWHGTSKDTVEKIAVQGFLRQFGTRQAYGDGVYFAVNSSYSIDDTYSVPDSNGYKRMILARVLTGEYAQGYRGLKLPPTRPDNSSAHYDSVVDDPRRPSIFVLFGDDQAYPEYIVTFKRKDRTYASSYTSPSQSRTFTTTTSTTPSTSYTNSSHSNGFGRSTITSSFNSSSTLRASASAITTTTTTSTTPATSTSASTSTTTNSTNSTPSASSTEPKNKEGGCIIS